MWGAVHAIAWACMRGRGASGVAVQQPPLLRPCTAATRMTTSVRTWMQRCGACSPSPPRCAAARVPAARLRRGFGSGGGAGPREARGRGLRSAPMAACSKILSSHPPCCARHILACVAGGGVPARDQQRPEQPESRAGQGRTPPRGGGRLPAQLLRKGGAQPHRRGVRGRVVRAAGAAPGRGCHTWDTEPRALGGGGGAHTASSAAQRALAPVQASTLRVGIDLRARSCVSWVWCPAQV